MISRIWHGYTDAQNANAYETLLKNEIFVNIENMHIPGFKEIQLFRRTVEDEVEFVTIMWFDSIQSVKQFAGEDYTAAVVPNSARRFLKRFDSHSQHYELRAKRKAE